MSSINSVQLMGRLGKEPELKTLGETFVCNFSLATSRKVKGEEVTDWHQVTAWGKTAEVAAKHLNKGDPVHLSGHIEYQTYHDKDGVKKYATKIVAEKLTFVPTRVGKENAPEGAKLENLEPLTPTPVSAPKKDVFDEDIPF